MPKESEDHPTVTTREQMQAKGLVKKAVIAAGVFNQLDQAHTDRIVEAVARAGFDARVRLAKMACEETKLGVWEHKVLKNVLATQFIYESIRDEKTVGVLSSCPVTGITELAQPLGPIFGIIPVTNPTSTVMFKILIALKTRNPIILSPSPKAYRCSVEAARICYEAALAAEAPEDCVQWVPESSMAWTHALMTHPDMALILATGGSGLVHAAYGSGTPALGVGPGNVPVLIDRSADLPFTVTSILASKTFDNGTICASEQAVVMERSLAPAVRAEFERQGGYLLKPDEVAKVQAVCVDAETGLMKPALVGQSVDTIAKAAGIRPPAGTRLLLAPLKGVGKDIPLSGEVLAPVLSWYEADDLAGALKICLDLNYLSGVGHTASIYANDDEVIRQFADIMNAGRVVVNTPSAQGGVGGLFNTLTTSFTLGCGAGGKNITTENISARNLINIKRVCRRRNNERFTRFDTTTFMDESKNWDAIWADYNRNY